MPKSLKITKEKILEEAFNITKTEGIKSLSNRRLAKKLNSSIRPIYYQFKNAEELNGNLYTKIEKYFYQFLIDNIENNMPPYKSIGINYIRFAKKEPNLFKVLFMDDNTLIPKKFINKDIDDYKKLAKIIKVSTNLEEDKIDTFHTKMWIFTHGLATLVVNDAIKLNLEQIKQLLTQEFQALMLLEQNKGDEKL